MNKFIYIKNSDVQEYEVKSWAAILYKSIYKDTKRGKHIVSVDVTHVLDEHKTYVTIVCKRLNVTEIILFDETYNKHIDNYLNKILKDFDLDLEINTFIEKEKLYKSVS